MNKLIACCGLDCVECPARKATMTNDDDLRRKTAQEWSAMYNAEIPEEAINCTGCREEGAKFYYCGQCEISRCAKSKEYDTCADCAESELCPILKPVIEHIPDAAENLKSLRS